MDWTCQQIDGSTCVYLNAAGLPFAVIGSFVAGAGVNEYTFDIAPLILEEQSTYIFTLIAQYAGLKN